MLVGSVTGLDERLARRLDDHLRQLAGGLDQRPLRRLAGAARRGLAAAPPHLARGSELRAILALGQRWQRLDRLVARARRRPSGSAIADLFAALADTPHLLEAAPAQHPDAGFVARAAGVVARLEQILVEDMPLALAPLIEDGLAGDRFRIPTTPSLERACPAGVRPLGDSGFLLAVAPARDATLELGAEAVVVRAGDETVLRVDRRQPHAIERRGARVHPRRRIAGSPSLRLGPALRARRGRLTIAGEDPVAGDRLAVALDRVRRAWPPAWDAIHRANDVIVPIDEPGTVSYSMADRPGHAYINVQPKTSLELSDDLVHETAHLELHALEEVGPLVDDDGVPEWWSPWRRAWRPLRGIVHASYTFTCGARLFAALASSGAITRPADLAFTRRRLLEEVTMVGFSLQDLARAEREGRLTELGSRLRRDLAGELRRLSPAARRARAGVGAAVGRGLEAIGRELVERRRRGAD